MEQTTQQNNMQNNIIEIEDDGSHSKINDYLIIKFLDRGAQGKVLSYYNNFVLFNLYMKENLVYIMRGF